tara:strand:- start:1906 stop:2073 length:168 start_codon:yes stop_codon:yes gene_type:complete
VSSLNEKPSAEQSSRLTQRWIASSTSKEALMTQKSNMKLNGFVELGSNRLKKTRL